MPPPVRPTTTTKTMTKMRTTRSEPHPALGEPAVPRMGRLFRDRILRNCLPRKLLLDRPRHALSEPHEKPRPAPGAPRQAVVNRQRAEMIGFCKTSRLAFQLVRIAVEAGNLVRAHAVGRQPLRDMDVAQALDVGEHLCGAGSCRRAGGREGIADQHDSRLKVTLAVA